MVKREPKAAPKEKVRRRRAKRRNTPAIADLQAMAEGFEGRVDALVEASTLKDRSAARVLAEQLEQGRLHQASLIASMLERGTLSEDETRVLQATRSMITRTLKQLGCTDAKREENKSRGFLGLLEEKRRQK